MAMANISVGELLHGCVPGRIQSVGYMQVIPLISGIEDERFVSPRRAKVSTTTYGTLVFDNTENKEVIVPAQAAYIVKQAAQDHAMTTVGLVPKKKTISFNTAACIQQTQGGTIYSDEHEMIILPVELRNDAHQVRKKLGYEKLWPAINAMNERYGVSRGYGAQGHLEYFMDAFKTQLDCFVAEFEPVPKQVGAIVLVGGRVVGIERTPNEEYWRDIWRTLIRECYGSLAILEQRKHATKAPPVPKTREALPKATDLSDLKTKLRQTQDREYSNVKTIVENVAALKLDRSTDATSGSFVVDAVEGDSFVGQVVVDGEKIVYASLVARGSQAKNEDWFLGKRFAM